MRSERRTAIRSENGAIDNERESEPWTEIAPSPRRLRASAEWAWGALVLLITRKLDSPVDQLYPY